MLNNDLVFIVNFEHDQHKIEHVNVVFLLLSLNHWKTWCDYNKYENIFKDITWKIDQARRNEKNSWGVGGGGGAPNLERY